MRLWDVDEYMKTFAGEYCKEGFAYSSGTNEHFLTVEELRELIREHVNVARYQADGKKEPRIEFLPYGRQHVTEEDIDAVCDVLRSDWLTQGPTVPLFEKQLSTTLDAKPAVACSTGTAALHLAMMALDIGPGDVVVTTPITFLADANCARYVGAEVRFADIDPETACMSPDALERVLAQDTEHRIKVVIPVHFAGQPADLPRIHSLAEAHGAVVVDDACHAPGAWYEDGEARYGIGRFAVIR